MSDPLGINENLGPKLKLKQEKYVKQDQFRECSKQQEENKVIEINVEEKIEKLKLESEPPDLRPKNDDLNFDENDDQYYLK